MSFGGWSIDYELFNWMKSNIDKNSTILEIGSGESTPSLLSYWNVISIEEDIEWVGRFHDNYIYSPIIDGWYDMCEISKKLNCEVDVILIDGPAYGERKNMIKYIDFFLKKNPKVLIFDDTDRENDLFLFNNVIEYFNEINLKFDFGHVKNNKMFSYINIK